MILWLPVVPRLNTGLYYLLLPLRLRGTYQRPTQRQRFQCHQCWLYFWPILSTNRWMQIALTWLGLITLTTASGGKVSAARQPMRLTARPLTFLAGGHRRHFPVITLRLNLLPGAAAEFERTSMQWSSLSTVKMSSTRHQNLLWRNSAPRVECPEHAYNFLRRMERP